MVAGLLILFGYLGLVWLIFFRLRSIRFSIGWASSPPSSASTCC